MSEAITDKEVAAVLGRAVWVINPVLDVLSTIDPLGLRGRTKRTEPSGDSVVDRGLDAMAWVLNTVDVPGTKSWDGMSLHERSAWWVRRVGALNNLVVAYPGVFGALLQRLPLQDALGFANQSIVLCAVAREYGIVDQHKQVELIAAVLCQRNIGGASAKAASAAGQLAEAEQDSKWTPFALAKALWRITKIVRGITDELGKRPRPKKIFRLFGMLPAVGVIADYFGEFGALSRAAKAGQQWIAAS
ncbi:hypothetical protein [Antrihabitans spumae]|uniref:EcsC family protein n=1 Tax=Antrihabitans spumae TaxID=3373370 RepID=A0ABW7K7F9_9NOCA